jgi:hypothetical protein
MNTYAIKRPDGGVTILTLAHPDATIHGEIDKLLEAHPEYYGTPDPDEPGTYTVEYHPVGQLPKDRTFRDAWTADSTGKVNVDLPKATEIHKNRWREARKAKLEALDVEHMRAIEVDDKAKMREVSAKKQALRDVTKTDLNSIKTPDELAKVWPEILK